MAVTLLCLRLFLAAVFSAAAVAKISDGEGTRRALKDFGAPAALAPALALLIPAAELLIAMALVAASTARLGATAALALLGLFSAAVLISLARGRAHACHCFGQFHSAPISAETLMRNLVLILMAALLVWRREEAAMLGVERWLIGPDAPETARAISGVLAVGIFGLLIALLARALKHQRRPAARPGAQAPKDRPGQNL